MRDWATHFGLVNIRKRQARHVWAEASRYILLASETVMEKERFSELPSWEQATAYAAAVGMTIDTAVVAGKAAARLLEIEVLGWDPVVELMHVGGVQPGSRSKWPEGVHYRYCALQSREVYEEHGLRVTNVPRTLGDIARYHGLMDGVVVMDSARKRWPDLTKEVLHDHLTRGRPYPGVKAVRRAIELSVPDAGSPLESQARFLLLEAALPQVESVQVQARFTHPGGHFDVDLLVNGWLVIEIDGEIKYDGVTYGRKTDEVIRDERAREKFLQNLGLVVLRVGHRDLLPAPDGGPCPLIGLVADALENFTAPRVRTSRTA